MASNRQEGTATEEIPTTSQSSDERADGGVNDERGGDEALTTYTDEEYGYRLAYPADWSVEAEPPGGRRSV